MRRSAAVNEAPESRTSKGTHSVSANATIMLFCCFGPDVADSALL